MNVVNYFADLDYYDMHEPLIVEKPKRKYTSFTKNETDAIKLMLKKNKSYKEIADALDNRTLDDVKQKIRSMGLQKRKGDNHK